MRLRVPGALRQLVSASGLAGRGVRFSRELCDDWVEFLPSKKAALLARVLFVFPVRGAAAGKVRSVVGGRRPCAEAAIALVFEDFPDV